VALLVPALAACAGPAPTAPRDGLRPIDRTLEDANAAMPLPSAAGLPERARVARVDVSKLHACAVLVSARVACWGQNHEGELGVALPRASATPLLVADVDRVTHVQAGEGLTCALRADADAVCWGKGAGVASIPGTQGATELVVSDGGGPFDACALLPGGEVGCWDVPEAKLIRIPSLSGSVSVELGEGLLCGVGGAGSGAAGRARCVEPAGQTWLRESPPENRAAEVSLGLPGVADLAISSDLFCARAPSGRVSCQLRHSGDFVGVDTPSRASGLFITRAGVCVLGEGGVPACFDPRHAGTASAGLGEGPVRDLACQGDLCCAVTDAGGVACRGFNGSGQLGDGVPLERQEPVRVEGVTGVTALDANEATCALGTGGALSCWGEDFAARGTPHTVLASARSLDLGADLLVVDQQGAVSRWQAGPPARCPAIVERPEPCEGVPVWSSAATPPIGPTRIARSTLRGDVCAITEAGRLACLVQRGARPAKRWTVVSGIEHAATIATGYDSVCAVTETRRVVCARLATVADDGTVRGLEAAEVSGLDAVSGLSGTTNAYYAERADGSVVRFRLSDGTVRLVPVTPLGGLTGLSARGRHACGVRKGEVLCFGTDDASLDKEKPRSVALPKKALAVAAGASHACALVEGGEVFCWGSDEGGQLGAGRVLASPALIPVSGLGPS
jgi:hypothetical protein